MGNLTVPWLFARFVAGATAALLGVGIALASMRVLRSEGEADSRSSEREFELVGAFFALASWIAWLELLVAVLGADRLAGSIRGAMCAYGVLDQGASGFRSLFVTWLAAVAATAWRALHRLDATQERSPYERALALSGCALAPVLVASFVLATEHALELDFRVVASCCSTSLGGSTGAILGRDGDPPWWAFAGSLVSVATTLGSVLATRRWQGLAWLTAVSASSGLALLPLTVVGIVAPHVYETPLHQCPFCLLRWDEGAAYGWPLAVLGIAVTIATVDLLVALLAGRGLLEPAPIQALRARASRRVAVFSALLGLWLAIPVARYAWMTDGASLWG